MTTQTLYGLHAVRGLLERDPARVKKLRVAAGRADPKVVQLLELAQRSGCVVQRVDPKIFERELAGAVHQGVVAEIEPMKAWTDEDLIAAIAAAQDPLVLVLDGVQDPHNLGACLRSAAAAGATAVVFPKDKAVQVNATVRKTSAGAADTLAIFSVTNLSRTLRDLQKAGVWIYGFAGEATASLYALDLKGNVALVMGSEGDGLRRLTRENCDQLVKIPMPGEFESLNVSVATGIALFEAVRQRL